MDSIRYPKYLQRKAEAQIQRQKEEADVRPLAKTIATQPTARGSLRVASAIAAAQTLIDLATSEAPLTERVIAPKRPLPAQTQGEEIEPASKRPAFPVATLKASLPSVPQIPIKREEIQIAFVKGLEAATAALRPREIFDRNLSHYGVDFDTCSRSPQRIGLQDLFFSLLAKENQQPIFLGNSRGVWKHFGKDGKLLVRFVEEKKDEIGKRMEEALQKGTLVLVQSADTFIQITLKGEEHSQK